MTDLDALIRSNNHIAMLRMIAEIQTHWHEIVDLASERCQSIGAAEYGTSSFDKPRPELRRERFEEYADALFYYQTEHRPGG